MSDEVRSPPTAAEFDAVMTIYLRSDTLRRAAADAYGAEYPAEINPFSGVTLSILADMAELLGVGPGQEFLDMACGAGGPGLWLARRTGAAVVGVDFSKVALSVAAERAAGFVEEGRARYEFGDFAAIPLDAASVDGVVCVDAFMFAPDKAQAAAEMARVMKPGARLVMTALGWRVEPPPGSLTPRDYRPFLQAAGLRILRCEEPERWQEYLAAEYRNWLANEAALVDELGVAVAAKLLDEARTVGPELADRQEVFLVAERP